MRGDLSARNPRCGGAMVERRQRESAEPRVPGVDSHATRSADFVCGHSLPSDSIELESTDPSGIRLVGIHIGRSPLVTSARRWRQRRNLRNHVCQESTPTQPVPQTSSAGTHGKRTPAVPSTKASKGERPAAQPQPLASCERSSTPPTSCPSWSRRSRSARSRSRRAIARRARSPDPACGTCLGRARPRTSPASSRRRA
jgi:hypothetical protein